HRDAWLEWAPRMRAAHAEVRDNMAALAVAIQRTGCDVAQARMSELERDMQPLAEEVIAAPATSLAGLRAKALVALWEALPANASHDGAFDFPDASRSLFDAVAEMIGLMPMVREFEARLAADVESRAVARSIAKMRRMTTSSSASPAPRWGRARSRRSRAPAASDRLVRVRSATRPGARQHSLPDAKMCGGEVSFLTSLSLHIIRSPVGSTEHRDFAERNVIEYRGRWAHSGLTLAAWITLAHFATSSAMSFPNSAGVIGIGAPPSSTRRALSLGSARPALISRFSVAMISGGVFLGALTLNHTLTS